VEEPRSGELQPKKGLWGSVPPKVRFLILSQVLNGFTFGYLGIFITGYLVQSGMSTAVVGILIGVEAFVMVSAGIPFAMFSDRRGRKPIIILGSALFAPLLLVFAFTRNVILLGMAASVGGLGEAMLLSSWNAMIADMTDLGNRDAAFSLSFITGAGSSSLGVALPLAFPAIQAATGMTSAAAHGGTMLLLGLVNFATPLILWVLLRNHHEKITAQERSGLHLGGMGQILRFSLCNSIIGFGAGLIIPLLASWLWLKFQVPDAFSGPYLALSGLTMAFAAIASPKISKRIGLFPAILTTQVSSTVFMFSLAFIPNVFLAGGVYLIRASLMNMNQPLMDSFLMGITPPQRRAFASTLNGIIWRIPNIGSSIIGGYILSSTMYNIAGLGLSHLDVPWVLATVFYVVGAALLFANFRNVKPKG
jgi:MFS family permease